MAALFAVLAVGFYLAPEALLILVGIGLPLAGGAVFGYRRHSFWWAVVAVVAAWLVAAVISTLTHGWDIGPAEDIVATVFFTLFLAGATMLGGLLGKHLASRPGSP
jgi:fatty-acid desaturase